MLGKGCWTIWIFWILDTVILRLGYWMFWILGLDTGSFGSSVWDIGSSIFWIITYSIPDIKILSCTTICNYCAKRVYKYGIYQNFLYVFPLIEFIMLKINTL
ncbi:MAG: hypothetical protein WCH52_10365 [Bacteroidota bacterium]